MPTTGDARPNMRRAIVLMTASSFLVPAAGIIVAPILARGLGAVGRGEMATALAPSLLILPVATLGLPEALTFLTAKHTQTTRSALAWASVISVVLGALCLLAVVATLPFLSAGDEALGDLIVLAAAFTIPALVVGAFRGAAIGRQMWMAVAVERLVLTSLRVTSFGSLWLLGQLTVLNAVLVSVVTPLIAGVCYWRLFQRPPHDHHERSFGGGTLRPLVSYGSKVWFGAVASMLLSRSAQILMTPLAGPENLGLFVVAITISDLPLVVALAIQGALFGVSSKSGDAAQVTKTARLTVLVGFAGCTVLGATAPFWIQPLFGPEFEGAIVPTLMLVASALICIPGLMAGAGLSAWKRPGLRSCGLVLSLLANVSVFVLLVPITGVIGGCWASIVSNMVGTGFMVIAASRVMRVHVGDFLLPRRPDVARLWHEGTRSVQMLLGCVRSKKV